MEKLDKIRGITDFSITYCDQYIGYMIKYKIKQNGKDLLVSEYISQDTLINKIINTLKLKRPGTKDFMELAIDILTIVFPKLENNFDFQFIYFLLRYLIIYMDCNFIDLKKTDLNTEKLLLSQIHINDMYKNNFVFIKKLKEYIDNPEYKNILDNPNTNIEDKIKCSFLVIQKTLIKYYQNNYDKLINSNKLESYCPVEKQYKDLKNTFSEYFEEASKEIIDNIEGILKKSQEKFENKIEDKAIDNLECALLDSSRELAIDEILFENKIDIIEVISNYIETLSDKAFLQDDGEDYIELQALQLNVQSQVEKKLKEGGIDIIELNRKLNIALFGDKGAKYYKFKGGEQK